MQSIVYWGFQSPVLRGTKPHRTVPGHNSSTKIQQWLIVKYEFWK